MKTACEYVKELRYKLRMMDIPCDFPALVYSDNQSVLVNLSCPDSVLRKKSFHVAYSFAREGSAKDAWCVAYIK